MGKKRKASGPTITQQLLTPLRESIVDKPPYTSGTLRLPNSCFSLFYKTTKDTNNARYDGRQLHLKGIESFFSSYRHINLASATHDELEQLTQACVPATFGVNEKDVLDETYRKAGKLDL